MTTTSSPHDRDSGVPGELTTGDEPPSPDEVRELAFGREDTVGYLAGCAAEGRSVDLPEDVHEFRSDDVHDFGSNDHGTHSTRPRITLSF